ncbi:hypothetical protein GE061_020349 [Apolygus lucorum]|uniref:Uncharacterized protein n=1 Tax=Apolygus lucorum TaxID=248454 RepID=A0A8S9WN68_APOLU|nr:hypothetical protein GE061_020349 [Apolygus lucorum]
MVSGVNTIFILKSVLRPWFNILRLCSRLHLGMSGTNCEFKPPPTLQLTGERYLEGLEATILAVVACPLVTN